MDVRKYWDAVLRQDAEAMRAFFREEAVINWHNTNERFTVPEFIRANCEYPGQWDGEVERILENGDVVITVTHVYDKEQTVSFHAVSFLGMKEGKICHVDEYWSDDGDAPQWRRELQIGSSILKG